MTSPASVRGFNLKNHEELKKKSQLIEKWHRFSLGVCEKSRPPSTDRVNQRTFYYTLMPNPFCITQMIQWFFFSLGEGKVPTNFLREEHFDVKAFPKHHPSGQYGLNHKRPIRLYPQMYFNQRLLNKDRRFSQDSCYLFMASYYIERLALEKQINISGKFS